MAAAHSIDEINIAITTVGTTTIAAALAGASDEARIKGGNLYFRNKGAVDNTILLDKYVGATTQYEVMEFTLPAGQEQQLVTDISQSGTGSTVRVTTSSTSAIDVTGTRIKKVVT